MKNKDVSIIALIGIWLGLLVWMAYQWWYPARLPAEVVVDDLAYILPLQIPTDFNSVAIAGLQHYDNLLQRPLFYPSRRPPEPQVWSTEPEIPLQEVPDEKLTLIGIVLMPEGMRALIKEDSSQRVSRLGIGDSVASWRLESIAAEQVRLSKQDRQRVLTLVRNLRQPTLERTPGPEVIPNLPASNTSPPSSEETVDAEQIPTS